MNPPGLRLVVVTFQQAMDGMTFRGVRFDDLHSRKK